MMNVAELRRFWQGRSARERTTLRVGVLAVTLAAAYGWLWRPMTADLARMQDDLPRLRAQASEIKLAAEEIARLRAKAPGGVIDGAQLAPLLTRTATMFGLPQPQVSGDAAAGRAKVTIERASFDQWLAWIDDLHRSHRVVVITARISALENVGIVRIEAELAPASEKR